MATQVTAFISSKMVELAAERRALEELLPSIEHGDVALRPWVFEETATASDDPIRNVYLRGLNGSALYVGIYGNEYGEGTIDEFEHATEWDIDRHIYIKQVDASARDPRLTQFLVKITDLKSGVTPKYFTTIDDLLKKVRESVEVWIQEQWLWRYGAPSAILIDEADDIPRQPEAFVGREALLAQTQKLLDRDNKPVLLHGFGGTGKTALAAMIVLEQVKVGKTPVLWLRTGSDDADAVFEALAAPFDAQDDLIDATTDGKIKVIRKVLNERGVKLVTLDDVWNGRVLNQVLEALRSVPVLVTSRQHYPIAKHVRVRSLERPAALALIGHYTGTDWTEDEWASRLCETLGDLPFALRIAGLTLQTDDITPQTLLKRIARAPHDIKIPEDFDEEGNESVAALLEASLKGLTSVGAEGKRARRLFQGFGALSVPRATPELLALYMELEDTPEKVEALLSTLQRRGLADRIEKVHDGNGDGQESFYYRIHDLAYSYIRANLPQKEIHQLRAVEACRDYVARHKDNFEKLELERNNILGACETAHQLKRDDLLIDILRHLVIVDDSYFEKRGHSPFSLDLLTVAVEAAKENRDFETAHYFLSKVGNAYADSDEGLDEALKSYHEALRLALLMKNPMRVAILMSVIATVYFRQDSDEWHDYMDRAEAVAREHNDDLALSQVLRDRGNIAGELKDYETARELFAEALKVAERLQSARGRFFALFNSGINEQELDDFRAALSYHQRAYDIAKTDDNQIWMAYALQAMGEDYHALDDREKAQESLNQALALYQQNEVAMSAKEIIRFMESENYPVVE